MMRKVEFPITVEGDEWPARVYADRRSLEMGVEFLDEAEGAYTAHDSDGRRIRLFVWELDLLLAQEIPANFDPANLEILEQVWNRDGHTFVETFDGVRLRSVTIDEKGRPVSASPSAWNGYVEDMDSSLCGATMSSIEFAKAWLHARLGHPPI